MVNNYLMLVPYLRLYLTHLFSQRLCVIDCFRGTGFW